jgi:hypothetical protein
MQLLCICIGQWHYGGGDEGKQIVIRIHEALVRLTL